MDIQWLLVQQQILGASVDQTERYFDLRTPDTG